MAFPTSAKGGSDWEPVPAGTHIARCVTCVSFGLQETGFGPKDKVYLGFEVPSVRVEWKKDDKDCEGPAIIGSAYTNSIHDKAILGQHLVSWRGRTFTEAERESFDLFTVVGVPCMISVTHKEVNGKTYANITGIMGLPPGTAVTEQETASVKYHPQDSTTSIEGLPEWMQKKIQAGEVLATGQSENPAPPIQPPPGAAVTDPNFDDDIPF